MKTLATDRALVTSWLLALAGMPAPPAGRPGTATAPSPALQPAR